jgi:hypothetical protein
MRIDFFEHTGNIHLGVGEHGRRWRISPTFTGWRLEFADPHDDGFTYAGNHRSVQAAKKEASAGSSTPRSSSLPS